MGTRAWRCRNVDSPFRKAVLRLVQGGALGALQRDAEVLSQLRHPNLGAVLGLASSGDELFLVSELVQGVSLDTWLEGGADPSPGRGPPAAGAPSRPPGSRGTPRASVGTTSCASSVAAGPAWCTRRSTPRCKRFRQDAQAVARLDRWWPHPRVRPHGHPVDPAP